MQSTLEPPPQREKKAHLKLPSAHLKLPDDVRQSRQVKWYSSPRQLLRTILMLDDTAHSIALGTALGMFVGMTPTVGVQMLLIMIFAYAVSPVLKFNRVAALVTVYVSNPLTIVPLYYFWYKIGTLFVGGSHTREHFQQVLSYDGFAQWWATIVELFVHIGQPLLIGSLLVASISAALTYPTMLWLIRKFQREHAI